jgi:hypothetical protein
MLISVQQLGLKLASTWNKVVMVAVEIELLLFSNHRLIYVLGNRKYYDLSKLPYISLIDDTAMTSKATIVVLCGVSNQSQRDWAMFLASN